MEESNNHIKSLDKTIEVYKLKLGNSDKETNLRTAAQERKLKLCIQALEFDLFLAARKLLNKNTHVQGDSKNSGSTTQTKSLQSLRDRFSSSGNPSRKNPPLPDHTKTKRM